MLPHMVSKDNKMKYEGFVNREDRENFRKPLCEEVVENEKRVKNWWEKKTLSGLPMDYLLPTNASLITGKVYEELKFKEDF